MRIFISTGEISGDLQGAMLIEALQRQVKAQNIPLEITALGGSRMAAAGATLLADTTKISSIGLLEALPFIIPTLEVQKRAKKYLQANPPDILVLIDYPGPNLVIGKYVRANLPNVKIIYYIAPQDWAVPMLGHAKHLEKIVDQILAIFPAEADYFQSQGIDVKWVGHPLLDRIKTAPNRQQARELLSIKPEQLIITLLPVSRKQELKYLLPIILTAAQEIQTKLPDVHYLIPVVLSDYEPEIAAAVQQYNLSATLLKNQTLSAIAAADLAITKSGTVNLEIALLNIPQVVLYRIHPFTAWIARSLLKFKIPLMSPTNLLVNQKIVPELQQEEATPTAVVTEVLNLLLNEKNQRKLKQDYQQMRSLLGKEGVCDRAASQILALVKL
ncbi:MAG: lipid-A-disaccharide synthase [Stanieria sp.]